MHTRKRYRSKINDTFSVNFTRIDSKLPAFILNHTIRNVCEQECIQFSTWRCKKNDNSYTIKLNELMEKKSNLANFSNKPKPDFPSFRWTSNWFPCKYNISNWPNDETTRVWEMIWKVYFTSGWRTILTLFFNRYYSEGVCESNISFMLVVILRRNKYVFIIIILCRFITNFCLCLLLEAYSTFCLNRWNTVAAANLRKRKFYISQIFGEFNFQFPLILVVRYWSQLYIRFLAGGACRNVWEHLSVANHTRTRSNFDGWLITANRQLSSQTQIKDVTVFDLKWLSEQ